MVELKLCQVLFKWLGQLPVRLNDLAPLEMEPQRMLLICRYQKCL
jgi:hypothetical protein